MFPNYKRKFLIFKVEDGWKNLGKTEKKYEYDYKAKGEFLISKAHTLCNTQLNVGKQNGRLFLFCPKCMVEIDRLNNVPKL
jgi:hypothetical protein